MPGLTDLPSAILQRLAAEPAMLAVLMAGGVGATAIGASVSGQDETTALPAAEEGQAVAPAETVAAPAQPVLLNLAKEPAIPLAEPDAGPVVTVGQQSEASATGQVVAEPVPATVLGPYVPLPSIEASPAEALEPEQVDLSPAPEPLELASVRAPEPEPAAISPASEEPAAAFVALEPELAAELPAVTEPALVVAEPESVEPVPAEAEPAPAPQVAVDAPVEQVEAPAPVELTAEQAVELVPVAELAAQEPAGPAPVEELAAEEPARAVEPTGQGNAFALAFADIAQPDFASEVLAQPEQVAAPDPVPAPAAELAPAPMPEIASVAFDLSTMPSGLAPAAPGSAFVRTDEAAGAAQGAQSPSHGRGVPGNRYRLTGNGIEFQIPAVLFGEELGTVPLRIGSTNLVSVRLGDLLALVERRMDPAAYARLARSRNSDEYVSFSTLRDAGIDLRYDAANDRLILGE